MSTKEVQEHILAFISLNPKDLLAQNILKVGQVIKKIHRYLNLPSK